MARAKDVQVEPFCVPVNIIENCPSPGQPSATVALVLGIRRNNKILARCALMPAARLPLHSVGGLDSPGEHMDSETKQQPNSDGNSESTE
jgi:hypothetical protein